VTWPFGDQKRGGRSMLNQRGETASGAKPQRPALSLPQTEAYQPGVDLSLQGELARYVYCVVKGVIKFTHVCPEGRESIVDLGFAGDLVGALPAILAQKCFVTATTLTDCRLARWKAPEFLGRVDLDVAFAVEVCRQVCRQACMLRRQVLALGSQTARQRLEGPLRSWPSSEIAGDGNPYVEFDFPLRRDEIGQLLSITPYHVSRLLSALEKDSLIKRRTRRICVLPAALRASAQCE
jgi:CRP-like cAMP-binding protein